MPLDAPALLEVLERHRVQYVVVGGYAAELHGSVRRTVDVDVVPSTTADNLERLAERRCERHRRNDDVLHHAAIDKRDVRHYAMPISASPCKVSAKVVPAPPTMKSATSMRRFGKYASR